MTLKEPVFQDVLDARRVIQPHIYRTPLRRYPALSDQIGAEVWVKHENFQVAGSFKVRGGLNLVARTTEAERARGFISASTGNHGQSVAFAAGVYGSKATIVVPEGANPIKVSAMRALGARVLHHGPVFDSAREHAEQMAIEDELRYVHPANEPLLIAGVATYTLEVHEDIGECRLLDRSAWRRQWSIGGMHSVGRRVALDEGDSGAISRRAVSVLIVEARGPGERADGNGSGGAGDFEFVRTSTGDSAEEPARFHVGERSANQRSCRPFHREHAEPDRIRRRRFPWRRDGDERDPQGQEGRSHSQRGQRLYAATNRFAGGHPLN